jgi:hypothetical protein
VPINYLSQFFFSFYNETSWVLTFVETCEAKFMG